MDDRRHLDAADSGYGGPERRRRYSNRFLDRYERRRVERQHGEHSSLVRPLRIGGGVGLILLGIAIGWLPGPGFVIFALPGAFMLASEIRRAALLLDKLENETIPRLMRTWARVRGGPKQSWVDQDPVLWKDWCERTGMSMPSAAAVDRRRRSRDAELDGLDPEATSER